MTVTIFEFDDYRQFVVAWLSSKKRTQLSMRWLSQKAGFRAHNYVQLVVQGKRNLSSSSIRKLATALALNEEETDFFELLVHMNQAQDNRERVHFFSKIARHPRRREIRPLEAAQLTFFRHWLAPVIFEMVSFPKFVSDPRWIAAQFEPPIEPSDVEPILVDLIRFGLIRVDRFGKWHQVAPQITSGENVKNLYLLSYHERALEQAVDALNEVSASRRRHHVLTSAVPRTLLPKIHQLTEKFEADFWALVEGASDDKDEVVQVGLQVFPVVKKRTSKVEVP